MIDSDIETYIRARLATVFPTWDEDQIIVQFKTGTIDQDSANNKRDNSGNWAIGTEDLEVRVNIVTEEKIDRFQIIRLFPRGFLSLTSGRTFQTVLRWVQSDWIEVAQAKGFVLFLGYEHEIFPS